MFAQTLWLGYRARPVIKDLAIKDSQAGDVDCAAL
jgi:hypothetical protein